MTLTYFGRIRTETDSAIIQKLLAKGWSETTPEPVDTTVAPPDDAPMWAFRAAVELDGSVAAVQAAISALGNNRRIVAQNKWDRSDTVTRNSAFIRVIATGAGWGNKKVEKLFQDAIDITTEKIGA